jgi:hypothetical protein
MLKSSGKKILYHQFFSLSLSLSLSVVAHFQLLSPSEQLDLCSVCDPPRVFLTSKISYLLFLNFTHKTETGTVQKVETNNSNPPTWTNQTI